MGPKLYRVPIFFRSDIPSSVGSIQVFVTRINGWGFEPHQKLHFWIGPQLFTIPCSFHSHVLRMKAEHYTSWLQQSWLLPCGWVSSDISAVSSKAVPDTILPIVQWRCRLQSPRSLAFMSCMFCSPLYIRCHQTQHATAFYIWTSPLCSSRACLCISTSLCRYRVLIFFLQFLFIYRYTSTLLIFKSYEIKVFYLSITGGYGVHT